MKCLLTHWIERWGWFTQSYFKVKFYPALDILSISAYFRLRSTRRGPYPNLALTRLLYEREARKIDIWRRRSGLAGKKVLIAEFGIQSKSTFVSSFHFPILINGIKSFVLFFRATFAAVRLYVLFLFGAGCWQRLVCLAIWKRMVLLILSRGSGVQKHLLILQFRFVFWLLFIYLFFSIILHKQGNYQMSQTTI